MSEKNDGGPAFPSATTADMAGIKIVTGISDGMTLRDWFAGQALSGLCADPNSNLHSQEEICLTSYEMADAMLAERDR